MAISSPFPPCGGRWGWGDAAIAAFIND